MRKLLPAVIILLTAFGGLDSACAHHAGNRPEDVGNINEEMVHGINYDEGDEVGGWGMGSPDDAGMPPIDDFGYPGEGEMNQNYTDNGQPPDESIFYPVQRNSYIEMNEWEHTLVYSYQTALKQEVEPLVYGYSPPIENIAFIPEPMTLALLGLGALCIRKKS